MSPRSGSARPDLPLDQPDWPVRDRIAAIPDPEIPVITIEELGILRDVEVDGDLVRVTITPTYSGCPAMDAIRDEIARVAAEAGLESQVQLVYAPAWTTDWISPEALDKLEAYGVAPPRRGAEVRCPQCSGATTTVVSQFGSTACKALMVCDSCGEPFDLFKVH